MPDHHWVSISQFLTPLDYRKIRQKVDEIRSITAAKILWQEIEEFFPAENFLVCGKKLARDELFAKVCAQLTTQGVVGPDFADLLVQPEKMSSTASGRIAIPHFFAMTAYQTQGFVVISPRGIVWNEKNRCVNLVFVLAVNKDNKLAYRNVFDGLSQVAVDNENVAKLVQSRTYPEFVDTLVALK
ncbi:PTS sugar transporter subunit IIA [Lactobacillus sp. DCY120]|uniref:PTS sugar transporter subunit IIA n=1 Tax=Bombilactobacillus apium TaxID=2675299 RepID=A0A850R690_9LACO|nr:PTS sugar transporter subunit IIA [Bombilactobacillus apium]NVY96152.1 PTS sugar transporter subunit IIA [Bombilactobacillus apium]